MEDDQQFCLRWNNHQSTLISVFDTLLENETLVDCTIAAEGRFLKAHKVVLSACSPYFATLLQEQYDKHPIFILKDVKFQELRAMMDYMYRGEVNISQDQLAALLKAAESLQIKGLSDSRGAAPRQEQQPPRVNVPIGGGNKNSYTLETKRVRIGPGPLDSQDISGSREGSSSPSRRRRKVRRRSIENDVHDNSNSSITPQNQGSNATLSGVSAITAAALASQMTVGGAGSVVSPAAIASAVVGGGHASGTTQQLTTNVPKKTDPIKSNVVDAINTADGGLQTSASGAGGAGSSSAAGAAGVAGSIDDQDAEHIATASAAIAPKEQKPNHKQKSKDNASTISPGEMAIEPKSEYDEEANEESVEDLTMDDEMGMDDLDHNAGTSQGGEGSSQEYAWQHDRSQDGLLLTTQETQQRDPQAKLDKSEQTDSNQDEFELDDCLLESNDIVITQNKDGFVLHVKKYGNVATAAKMDSPDEEQASTPDHHHHHHQSHLEHDHHTRATAHHQETITILPVPGHEGRTLTTSGGAQITEIQHVSDAKPHITHITTPHSTIKLPSTECELINIKKILPTNATITSTHHPHITSTIIQHPHHLQPQQQQQQQLHHHQQQQPEHSPQPQQHHQQHQTITIHHAQQQPHQHHQELQATSPQSQAQTHIQTHTVTHTSAHAQAQQQQQHSQQQTHPQQHQHIQTVPQQHQQQVVSPQQAQQVQSFVSATRSNAAGQPQTINVVGLRNVHITEQKPIISRIKYSASKIITPNTANVQIVEAHEPVEAQTHHHHSQDLTEVTKYEISEIDLSNPNTSAAMINDFVKYAEIDDIELPDGTKIGIGFAPTELEHIQTAAATGTTQIQTVDAESIEHHHQHHQHHHQHQQPTIQHIQLQPHIQVHHSGSLSEHIQASQTSASSSHHHLQQLQLQDHDDATTSVDESIMSDTMVHEQPTITKSYTILTTRPIKQESGAYSGDTTTYELSISDSSMGATDDPDSKHICRHCGKKYRWKSTLRRHENVECGGKEPCHPCPHCSYKAKQRGNLGVHVRKHHPDKPQLESKRGRKI